MAREHGVGLKIIWREEEGCGDNCDPGFNSTWSNLFSEPKLRLADNFPGTALNSACGIRRPSLTTRGWLFETCG